MSHEVRLLRSAEKELDKLPKAIHARISHKILSLENNPRPRSSKKLSDREEYRLRVGDYRILYTIEEKDRIITVFAIAHRREAYR